MIISGSFAAVLLATVIDTDLVIHLENIPQCSVVSLSGFASILAIARGMILEENRVFDSKSSYQGDPPVHKLISGRVVDQDDVNTIR